MESNAMELVSGMHQLFKYLEANLNDVMCPGNSVEDVIRQLEETDENFHRYEFVKQLWKILESSMGGVIDGAVEKRGGNSISHHESFVQAVTGDAVDSKQFSELLHDVCMKSTSAASALLKCFEDETGGGSGREEDAESQLSKQMRSMFSEGASTSGSTFNQGMFFMSQEQFHSIAREMDASQPASVRQNALQRLCQVPPSDVMASESWATLCVSLMDALADRDPLISHKALSFHAKMFAVTSHQILRETHTCLTGHLVKWFESAALQLPLTSEVVDVQKPHVKQVIKRMRLLNEFQCEVPTIWVRFPESFVERVINSTFMLLSLHLKPGESKRSSSRLSALDIISIIDTKACWFRKWLHGNYSRAIAIKTLKDKYSGLLAETCAKCLKFCEEYSPYDEGGDSNQQQVATRNKDKTKRSYFTAGEMRYLGFVHSLTFISQLLTYSESRRIFPLDHVTGFSRPITTQHILIAWIRVLDSAKFKPRTNHKGFEPASLAGKALTNLCSSNPFVRNCVDGDVIEALLRPMFTWLENSPKSRKMATEATMLYVAEILACLAATCSGRKLLLQYKIDNSRLCAAHVVAKFVHKLLCDELPTATSSMTSSSRLVTGAFVFVCRQMYNTCDGLLLLAEFDLHKAITAAWRQAQESGGARVTTEAESSPTTHTTRNSTWNENLLDNLLNFAATPKGILLLQQTGAMNEAVAYMHSRYAKKLQVSKCEKFGYGVMVTQVAATAAGITALSNAGFLSAIIGELWVNLEFATDEVQVTAPRPYPLQPIDRSVRKSFTSLVNIFSSYPAVHEIFCGEKIIPRSSYSIRESPTTALDLIDRLVLLNSEKKIHALLNYEQSHLFGLRLLTALACSLDTWLLLETQYNIQQTLLDAQKGNRTYEGEIIIDQLSIERNHLLVRTYLIGGHGERNLPPRTLHSSSSFDNSSAAVTSSMASSARGGVAFPWPLFSNFPMPREYAPTSATSGGQPTSGGKHKGGENALSKLVSKSKTDKNRSWLQQLQQAFQSAVVAADAQPMTPQLLCDVIDRAMQAMERMPEEHVFKKQTSRGPSHSSKLDAVSDVVAAGVRLAVRYGRHVGAVKSSPEGACNNLTQVVQTCSRHLNDQQAYSPSYKLTSSPFPCHDWFASTVFLMTGGSKEKSSSLLIRISQLLCSGFLWPARLHASIHLKEEVRSSGISPLYSCTGHHVELVLQAELPLTFSAFRMCGYTPSQITQHWLSQCFWNYLRWPQIALYVTIVVVMGADYQVYMCVSILKHLQRHILAHRQTQDLLVFLKEKPLSDFDVGCWMKYMRELESKYRAVVLSGMREIVQPRLG